MTTIRKSTAQEGYFSARKSVAVAQTVAVRVAMPMTAEGMSKAIYKHDGFTRDAALKAFGHIERRTK